MLLGGNEVVKRWVNEVQEAVSSENKMVQVCCHWKGILQYHILLVVSRLSFLSLDFDFALLSTLLCTNDTDPTVHEGCWGGIACQKKELTKAIIEDKTTTALTSLQQKKSPFDNVTTKVEEVCTLCSRIQNFLLEFPFVCQIPAVSQLPRIWLDFDDLRGQLATV